MVKNTAIQIVPLDKVIDRIDHWNYMLNKRITPDTSEQAVESAKKILLFWQNYRKTHYPV